MSLLGLRADINDVMEPAPVTAVVWRENRTGNSEWRPNPHGLGLHLQSSSRTLLLYLCHMLRTSRVDLLSHLIRGRCCCSSGWSSWTAPWRLLPGRCCSSRWGIGPAHTPAGTETHTHTHHLVTLWTLWLVFVFVADSSFSLWCSWTWLCLLKPFPGEDVCSNSAKRVAMQIKHTHTHTMEINTLIGFDSVLHLFILQLLLLSFGATVAWITLWYQLQKLCVCVSSVIVLRNVCVRLFALMSTFQPLHKYLHSTPTKKTSNSFFSSPG